MMDICKPSFIRFYIRELYGISTAEANRRIEEVSDILKEKWIKSEYSDFSIYAETDYIFELVKCYFSRSRNAVNQTKKFLPELESILDYYNGNGLTTVQINYLWPLATVFYFNDIKIQSDWMFDFCRRFRIPHKDIKPDGGRKYDAIFLFEVLEHMENPEDFFLENIHGRIKKYLVYSAPFGDMATGHFPKYDGVDGGKYSNHFKKFLYSLGYELIYRGFNQVPLVFEKVKK